jgi:hypothetical protein
LKKIYNKGTDNKGENGKEKGRKGKFKRIIFRVAGGAGILLRREKKNTIFSGEGEGGFALKT